MDPLPAKPLHTIMIVSGRFPDPDQVFIQAKILGLALRGHSIVVLSSAPGDEREWRRLTKRHPELRIRRVSYPEGRIRRWLSYSVLPIALAWNFVRSPGATRRLVYSVGLPTKSTKSTKPALVALWKQLPLLHLARGVDVVHFEWNNQAAGYVQVLKELRVPIVVSCRGRGITAQPLSDHMLAMQLPELFSISTKVHFVSHDLLRAARKYGVDEAKSVIINPAIDIELFNPPYARDFSERPFRILTVARLVWKKNILGALQVIRRLKDHGHDVRYDVIGKGPEEEAIRYAIQDLDLCDNVFLTGNLPHREVINALSQAHAFMMPSIQEGFCNAVLEAQAMELPVVVTDADGLTENVEPGKTGLVANRWNVESLTTRMEELLLAPELCQALGRAGRLRVLQYFTLGRQMSLFEELYEEAILAYSREGTGDGS